MTSAQSSPVAFLFYADEPSFDMGYDAAIFRIIFGAILTFAPNAEFRFRFGDIVLHQLSHRVIEVGVSGKGSPSRGSHIKYQSDALRRATLAWDFFDSATDSWSSIDSMQLFMLTNMNNMCAICLSKLSMDEIIAIDKKLHERPGYLDAMAIDLGNPLHVVLLCRSMIYVGFYRLRELGLVHSSPEDPLPDPSGKEGWWSELPFMRVYLAAQDEAPPPCMPIELSIRGQLSQRVLKQNIANTHQERVAQILFQGVVSSRSRPGERLFKVGSKVQIDTGILEQKLKSYVLNTNHEKGKHKATLLNKTLGITDQDWHYLSEQIISGIEYADVERVRESEYGVQYQANIKVRGRNGAEKPLLTAWIALEDGTLRLTTAYLAESGSAALASPISEYAIDRSLQNDEDWQTLYDTASRAGKVAAQNIAPVPIFVGDVETLGSFPSSPQGYDVISEGLCGGAFVCINAEQPFANWLYSQKLGMKNKNEIEVSAQSGGQSVMRAEAYAKAFAAVLRLHGISCSTRTYLS